jgi:hypothetical protein
MIKDDNLKLKEKFLDYYRDLPVQKLACEFIGKSEDTIIRWKKDDEDFANQQQQAKANWAMLHSKGVKSDEWILERVMKDHFSQKQSIDLTSGEEPITGFIFVKDKDDSPDNTDKETI